MARDPVEFWLGRVGEGSRASYKYELRWFLDWLNGQSGWSRVGPSELLERQRRAEDQYALLDLLQKYVSGLERTLNGKRGAYIAVRSFFMHNRTDLPSDRGFKVRGTKSPLPAKLTMDHIRRAISAANLRDRSILLVKWQSLQDTARLVWIGRHMAGEIVRQIREGVCPVRIDIPMGRKRNTAPYFTFIGKDAIDALKEYFEKERGWPKPGEPIWLERYGRPLSKTAFNNVWLSLLRRVGLIPKKEGAVGTRYGFGGHNMRDEAKTLLHTHALKDGYDLEVSKFLMGHGTDDYYYDKFNEKKDYVLNNYKIAEPYLNISSNPLESEQVQQQDERIKGLEKQLADLRQMITAGISQLDAKKAS